MRLSGWGGGFPGLTARQRLRHAVRPVIRSKAPVFALDSRKEGSTPRSCLLSLDLYPHTVCLPGGVGRPRRRRLHRGRNEFGVRLHARVDISVDVPSRLAAPHVDRAVCTILVPAAALFFSLRQPARYVASADVLLSRTNLGATLSGSPTASPFPLTPRWPAHNGGGAHP